MLYKNEIKHSTNVPHNTWYNNLRFNCNDMGGKHGGIHFVITLRVSYKNISKETSSGGLSLLALTSF